MLTKIVCLLIITVTAQLIVGIWRYNKIRTAVTKGQEFINRNLARAEAWGTEYEVVMHFDSVTTRKKPGSPDEIYDVTLVTQCSVNNILHLPELASRWTGTVSIAIFAPHSDYIQAYLGVRWLRLCFPKTFQKAEFHLLYPIRHKPTFSQKVFSQWEDLYSMKEPRSKSKYAYCSWAVAAIERFGGSNYNLAGIEYPHNALRNVAKMGVRTEFMLLVDADTFPALNIRDEFLVFFSNARFDFDLKRTALVVPAFEVQNSVRLPATKTNLIKEYKRGNARPFHSETCRKCHAPTRFNDWLSMPENSSMPIAYETEWKDSWEPFYIATTSKIPDYDESFRQYGFDRISQVCEVYLSGFVFHVLNNAFVVHKGFKRPHEFHSNKNVENQRNYKIFIEKFLPHMEEKYPDAKRSCIAGNRRKGISQAKFRPHFDGQFRQRPGEL